MKAGTSLFFQREYVRLQISGILESQGIFRRCVHVFILKNESQLICFEVLKWTKGIEGEVAEALKLTHFLKLLWKTWAAHMKPPKLPFWLKMTGHISHYRLVGANNLHSQTEIGKHEHGQNEVALNTEVSGNNNSVRYQAAQIMQAWMGMKRSKDYRIEWHWWSSVVKLL